MYLQLLHSVDELCLPYFVGPDKIWDVVDDSATMMVVRIWSVSRYIISVYLLSFLNLLCLALVP